MVKRQLDRTDAAKQAATKEYERNYFATRRDKVQKAAYDKLYWQRPEVKARRNQRLRNRKSVKLLTELLQCCSITAPSQQQTMTHLRSI